MLINIHINNKADHRPGREVMGMAMDFREHLLDRLERRFLPDQHDFAVHFLIQHSYACLSPCCKRSGQVVPADKFFGYYTCQTCGCYLLIPFCAVPKKELGAPARFREVPKVGYQRSEDPAPSLWFANYIIRVVNQGV